MWRKIHRNYLPILSGLLFLFVLGVVVVEIDRQIYQNKKKEICIQNWDRLCPQSLTDDLFKHANNYLSWVKGMRSLAGDRAGQLRRVAEARRALDAETSRILSLDNCLVGISVFEVIERDGQRTRETVVAREVDKQRKHNTFRNCLVLRQFWGDTTMPIVSTRTRELVGEVVIVYTTPLGYEEIHALTVRFRFYLAGIVLLLGFIYYYILRHLIMPIKLITERIDRSKGALPEILANPRTALESAYNDLARDALLSATTRVMAEHMSVDRLVSRDEIVGSIPEMVAPNFGFAAVYALELVVGEGLEEPVRWCRSAHREPGDGRIAAPSEADWVALGRQFDLDWGQTILDFSVGGNQSPRPYFAVPIASDRENRRVTFLAATPRESLSRENLRWHRETLLRLANAIRASLETLDLQRDLIVREKSKANISLSRNLGHDLTNVIATSKLELDTVRRILGLPPEQQSALDPQQRAMFSESLQGLLNNTKFLQEIINIYRSFSYMRHPEYEWVDLNALVEDVVELFELSLSRRIQIHRAYGSDVPSGYVEPRLLKLALFNLLTNATDALKRRAMRDGDYGAALWITTTYDAGSGEIAISVRDNGLGILNPRRELATADEIRVIFQAGFTTKRGGMAEGLGLNWVRQIVYDFHRGQLRARNHPEGGAEVSLIVPRYEQPPNLEGFGGSAAEASPDTQRPPQVAEVRNP